MTTGSQSSRWDMGMMRLAAAVPGQGEEQGADAFHATQLSWCRLLDAATSWWLGSPDLHKEPLLFRNAGGHWWLRVLGPSAVCLSCPDPLNPQWDLDLSLAAWGGGWYWLGHRPGRILLLLCGMEGCFGSSASLLPPQDSPTFQGSVPKGDPRRRGKTRVDGACSGPETGQVPTLEGECVPPVASAGLA